MKIVEMDIGKVIPYENNPRDNEDAVDSVAKSIQNYGWQQPIVVDENNVVIVGHTRLLAARKLGLKQVPVHVAEGLSPEKVKAYRLDDNKTSEKSRWNFDKLKIELSELGNLDYDLSSLAFETDELSKLMNDDSPTDEGEPQEEKPPKDMELPDASYVVIVECKDETEQESLFNKFSTEGLKCRVSTL